MNDASPRRGRLFGWVSAKPKTAFWTTLVVALLLGAGIGAAGADNSEDLTAAKDELTAVKDDLGTERARANTMEGERDEALEEVERATAKGEVPSFVGDSIGSAETSELVERFGWKITSTNEPSDEAVGTVLKQSIPEGDILRRGQAIALTVAAKRPKQWTTIFEQSGSGQLNTDEFRIPAGKVRVVYSFGGSSNSVLTLKTPGDDLGDELLVNEIGAHEGTSRIYDAEGTHYLELMGDSWTVSVQVFK